MTQQEFDIITNASYTDTINKVFASINDGFLPNATAMRKEVRNINKQIKAFKVAVNFATPKEVARITHMACVLDGRKKVYQYFIRIATSGKC